MAPRSKPATDGGRLLQSGLLNDAVRTFEAGVHADPKDQDCWLGLGRAHLAAGRPEQARTAFQKLLALVPTHLEAQSAVAMVDVQQDRPGALERLRAVAAQPGAGFFEHFNLAQVLQARNDLDGAAASYELALKVMPNNPFCLYELGRLSLDKGDTKKAIGLFKRIVEMVPREVDPQLDYARALVRDGQLGQAIAALEKAIEAVADEPLLHEDLFEYAMLAGALPRAREAALALQDLRPDEANPLYLEGLALLTMGQVPAARARFEEAARRAPEAWQARHAWAKCLMVEKDLAQALRMLEEVVQQAPGHPGPANDLATLYLEKQDGARAVAVLQPVHDANPDDEATHLNLALAFVQQKKKARAAPHVKRVLKSADAELREQAERLQKHLA